MSGEIPTDMIEAYRIKRSKVSAHTANKDLRYLRAMFNQGLDRRWISGNPTQGVAFLREERKERYVPSLEDVLKVIMVASPEMQDYLWILKETMGRMGEINRLTWSDVDFEKGLVILRTRKKKGGHLTPRWVYMSNRVREALHRRYGQRHKSEPWVFWHRYWDTKERSWVVGPYKDRKRIMKHLCEKAGVKYFRFHALRHFGASELDQNRVSIGTIQRILGHENRSTTEGYLHAPGESEREAVKVFDRTTINDSHMVSHTSMEQNDKMGLFNSN